MEKRPTAQINIVYRNGMPFNKFAPEYAWRTVYGVRQTGNSFCRQFINLKVLKHCEYQVGSVNRSCRLNSRNDIVLTLINNRIYLFSFYLVGLVGLYTTNFGVKTINCTD